MEMVIFTFFFFLTCMQELAEFALYYLFQKNLLKDEHQERGWNKIQSHVTKKESNESKFQGDNWAAILIKDQSKLECKIMGLQGNTFQ